MTVPSEQSRIQYTTDGTSVSFPVPFRFLKNQDLHVTLVYPDDATQTLSLDVDYTLTGANDSSGGTLTTVNVLQAGIKLLIERMVSITQETAYQRNDPFPERAHERALDKLTMICQQLASVFGMTSVGGRRVLMTRSTDEGIGYLPIRNQRSNRALGFDANGDPVSIPSDLPQLVDALERAEGAADSASKDANIARTQAGKAAASALSANADAARAEAAADAASLASGVYPDTDTILNGGNGYAPVPSGHFATTPSPDHHGFLNLYQVQSGETIYIDTYPNTAAIDLVIDFASKPALLDGDFYPQTPSDLTRVIADEDGKAIFALDEFGLPVEGWVADFHRPELDISVCRVDENGRAVLAVDRDGLLMNGWLIDFYSGADLPAISYVSEDGVVLMGWDDEGNMIVGSGGRFDPSSLAKSVEGLEPGAAWNDHGRVSVLAAQDSFFRTDPLSLFTDISVVYGLYDDLMAQFPDYITKRQLGADGLGNPIYEYSFKPADYHTLWYHDAHPDLIAKPKVCIIGGTHGNERHAIATNYTLMREIAVNWRNNPLSAALRWGCHIVIVPILTPSGFNARDRYNNNGVDVNRNYPTRWETATGPKGAAPLSELEAQAAVQFMTDHPDNCGFIDTHNAGALASTGYAFWIGTERGQTLGSALKVLDHMAEYDKREYSFITPDNSPIVRLTASGDGTAAKHMQAAFGYNGFLVETGAGFGRNYYERERHALEGMRKLVFQIMKQEQQRRIREYDFTWQPIGQSEIDDD